MKITRTVLVVLLFVALGVATTWPVWSDPFDTSMYGVGQNDTMFHMWTIFWGYHALTSDPGSLLNANIFYPEQYTYLYSDVLLADSIMAAPVIALTYDPHFTHNVLLLLSISLGGLGMFLLARDLVARSDAALIAALIFMFNPAHFGRLLQFHLFGDHWMPWFVWALLRWLRGCETADGIRTSRFGWGWAALAALFFVLNVLSGAHIAVFGTVIGITVGLFYMVRDGLFRQGRFWLGLAAMVVAALLVLGPIFYPYAFIQEKMREHRVDSDYALEVGSAGTYELLSANTRFYNWLNATSGWPGDLSTRKLRGYLFVGVMPLIIAFISFLRRGNKETAIQKTFQTIAAWFLDLALLGIAWMAAISAVFGNESFLFFYLRFPTPSSLILIISALIVAALRFLIFPQVEHSVIATARWFRRSAFAKTDQWPWLALALTGFLLALGPRGLLYLLFGKLPLISLIRVPSRFILVTAFAISVLCAYGVTRLISSRNSWRRVVIIIVICTLFAFEAMPEPVRTYPAEKPHPAYTWLGEQKGDFAVMEFPIGPHSYAAFIRQVYGSIYHWKKLIVGYSGFQSKENVQLIADLNDTFPADQCIEKMAELNVRYVIVIAGLLDQERKEVLAGQDRLHYEISLGGTDIYKLIGAKTR